MTLEQPLTLSQSVVGARVLARVQESVRAGAGDAGIPAGTLVAATIAGVQKAHGRLIPAHVRLSFETITIGTKDYPLSATIESTSVPESASQQARPAGRSSFAGTAPGAILVGVNAEGGSRQQSLVSLGTNESSLSLPAGTVLHLRLRDALRVQR